jgi:hypothetical protein
MLQLLLQQLLQRMPQKQIWTYALAVVTQYPWTLFVLPAAKKKSLPVSNGISWNKQSMLLLPLSCGYEKGDGL